MFPIATMCLAVLAGERLPGSDMSVHEATRQADLIIRAEAIGRGVLVGDGRMLDCAAFRLKQPVVLKGKAIGKIQDVSFGLKLWPDHEREEFPKAGEHYVFFLRRVGKTYYAVKIMPGPRIETI